MAAGAGGCGVICRGKDGQGRGCFSPGLELLSPGLLLSFRRILIGTS